MNICLTANYSPWSEHSGGGPIVTHNLANQLSKMGHKVFVVYTTDKRITPVDEVNYEIVWAKDVGKYIRDQRAINIFSVFGAVRKLAAYAHIDIIHGAADEAALLHFVAKRNKCAFVMTIHRPYYPKLNSAKLLMKPHKLYLEHICLLEWYAYKKAQKIFAVSNYAKNHVMANLGLRAGKIEVVYNGVAPEFFDVRRANIPTGEIKIISYGRLEPQKGIDVLLNSLPFVISSLKRNQRVNLIIAGRGPYEYEREYKKLAEDLGLSQNVSFVGWLNSDQLRQLLSEASLCVLPSRVESFGLAVAEAMAAGVPTISTNTSAIPEIITDGETGLLVPPENPKALADKIIYAISNPLDMESMAQAGRERIRQSFTWDKVADRYCKAYESLL